MTLDVRDRTGDFHAFASKRQKDGFHAGRTKSRIVPQTTPFAITARALAKATKETGNKIENLRKLAKTKSLFNDPALKIQELTYTIKEDITILKRDLDRLQNVVQNSNLPKQVQQHSGVVIQLLQKGLGDLVKSFQGVLELRTENMKQQRDRRMEFTGSLSTQALSPPASSSSSSSNVNPLMNDPYGPGGSGPSRGDGETAITIGGANGGQSLLQSEGYFQSRADSVEQIEGKIVELQSIFGKFTQLVAEQGEMVERIDSNIDNTLANVQGAEQELLKFYEKISGNRWLIVKIFFVLLLFAIVFLVFFV